MYCFDYGLARRDVGSISGLGAEGVDRGEAGDVTQEDPPTPQSSNASKQYMRCDGTAVSYKLHVLLYYYGTNCVS